MNSLSLLVAAALLSSCASEHTTHTDGETSTYRSGPIDWVRRGVGDVNPPLSVTAKLVSSKGYSINDTSVTTEIVCRTNQDQLSTHYITFERRGSSEAWGIYGLKKQKNGIPVPLPFSTHAVRYEDRTVTEALVGLLKEVGATEVEASEFVERHSNRLFAEGLRVIFVLDEERAPDIRSTFLEGADDPIVLSIELEPAME